MSGFGLLVIGIEAEHLGKFTKRFGDELKKLGVATRPGYQLAGDFDDASRLIRMGLEVQVVLVTNIIGMQAAEYASNAVSFAEALEAKNLFLSVVTEDEKLGGIVQIFVDRGITERHKSLESAIAYEVARTTARTAPAS